MNKRKLKKIYHLGVMRYSLVIFSLLIGTGAFSQINRQFEVKTFTNLTDTNSNGIVDDGDVVNFTVRVENTGNITLNSLVLTSTFLGLDSSAINLSSGINYANSSESNGSGTLIAGEVETYVASYTFSNVGSTGGISLSILGQAVSADSQQVSDTSDNGNNSDGNTTDDPNIINGGDAVASIEIDKVFDRFDDVDGDGMYSVGDRLLYIITVNNDGYQDLIAIAPDDALTDQGGRALALTAPFTPPGAVFTSSTYGNISDAGAGNGTTTGTLVVGETVFYSAVYTLDQTAIESGRVNNCLTAQANVFSTGALVTDSIDSCVENDIPHVTDLNTTKVASVLDNNNNGATDVGDTIVYDIFIENQGNVTISNLDFTENITNANGGALTLSSGPTFVSSTDTSTAQGVLNVSETERYRATFVITAAAANTGEVRNTLIVQADSPGQTNNVNDTSDDPSTAAADDATVVETTITKSIEVTKQANVLDDGDNELGAGDVIQYTITVVNTGQITLHTIRFIDQLSNGLGVNLSYDAPGIVNNDDPLAPGASRVYTANYTIQASDTDTGQINNRVYVYARSDPNAFSDVNDWSDDGIDTDGNTTDDVTETPLDITTGIDLFKTAVLADDGDGLPSAGDVITYTITVRNTGNVALENIVLSDVQKRGAYNTGSVLALDSGPTLTSSTNGSNASLILAGGELTYTATYTVVLADVNNGLITNQASVTADDVTSENNQVSKISDNNNDFDGNTVNDPTEVKLTFDGKIDASKTVDITRADPTKIQVGDVAVYTIVVTNTGNVRLTNISLADQLSGIAGVSLDYDAPGIQFVSSTSGSPAGTLDVGEAATYTATFTVTQEAVDQTGVENTVDVSGRDPANTLVQDDSDDGDDDDGNQFNDPTIFEIEQNPSIEVVKDFAHVDNDGDGDISSGDRINYIITIENTGNNTLGVAGAPNNELVIDDTVSTFAGTYTPTLVGPSYSSSSLGSPYGLIKPGEITTFTAYVVINQSIINAGGLINTASVTVLDPSNTSATDVSDDNDDQDGNLVDDPTENPIAANPSLNIEKTFTVSDTNGNGVNDIGDIVHYTITVSNTGNIDISSVAVTDTLAGLNSGTLDLTGPLQYLSGSRGSNSDVILVNEQANYRASFTINQDAVDFGGLRNIVTAQGIDDAQSGTITASTENVDTIIPANPSLTVTKTVDATDNDNDGKIGVGDTLTFTISILNTGNQTLDGFSFTDTLEDLEGNALSYTTPITTNDPENLLPGEIKTYTATFDITQQVVDNGGISNSVVVLASNLTDSAFVNDTSDDGDTGAGDTGDDPTIFNITAEPSLDVTKTVVNSDLDGDGLISEGDKLTYTINVENNGNITLRSLYVTDVITDIASNTRNLDNSNLPVFISNSLGSVQGTLLSGEIATYTATYTIVADDVTAGGVMNQAFAQTFSYPDGINPVLSASDYSDDGDDDDGNTENDRTISYTGVIPAFDVIKTYNIIDDGNNDGPIGDKVVFDITVTNTSNDRIDDIIFVDTITSSRGNVMSLDGNPSFVSATAGSNSNTLTVGGAITYTATFTINDLSIKDGGLFNTITFRGSSQRNPFPAELDTKDISDDGDTGAGDTGDDPTFVPVGLDSDGDGIPDNLDIDDDNDGVLDIIEQCIDFAADGTSFETYYKPGAPVNSTENKNSQYPASTVAPPFTSVNGDGEVWDNRTDGNNVNWSPAPGLGANQYFIELLQNAYISGTTTPTNQRQFWNEASPGIGDFDRIMVEEVVYPNTTYTISYYHKDGGLLEASHGDGGSTLLQVQSLQTDYAVDQLTETPSDWTQDTFQFTTDANTNRIAILFSAYAPGVNVSIQLDGILIEPQEECFGDIDNDSVGNGLDLDSDNDGIYDVIEAGNSDLDTNGDGRIDSNDAGFVDANSNGAHDSVESRTPTDTDSDTTIDMFDLDSDNDGCNDVKEAGYTDGDDDGLLGDSPVSQTSFGTVTGTADGYTDPSDLNSNGTKDFQEFTYDIGCYNREVSLDISKTYQTIDVNSDGVLGLNDQIVYTVVVTNTGEIALPLKLTDLLTNQDSQTIQTLELEFVGLSTPTTYNVPKNFIKRSAGFNFNTYSNSYWHTLGSDLSSSIDYNGNQRLQPAEALVYFSTDSGATLAQSGFSSDGLHILPQQTNNNILSLKTQTTPGFSNLNSSNYFNHFVRFRNDDNYTEGSNNEKQWFYQEVEGLQPNTQYTVSVFARPNEGAAYLGDATYNNGFQFVFHDGDSNSENWIDANGSYITNWNNAQKSTRFYFENTQVYRFSHTFTTDASVSTTRVGIAPPYGVAMNGAYFYGFQLEEGASMSPVYTYTYNNTVSATTVTLTVDPRIDALSPGVGATYQVTLTLTQGIVDNHQVLVNTVTATGAFITPGGNSIQASSTSDDPLTAQEDDPTIISLLVTPSVEITKTATITDSDGSGTTTVGDIITYTITVSNTGDTPLNDITITDILSGLETGTLSLSTSLTHVSSSLGSASDTLAIGEFSTFTVTFTVNEDAYYFGGTRNAASVEASAPVVTGGSATVTDTSDNVDHPIEDPSIEVTKTVSETDVDADGEVSVGDILVYTVTVENTGNVTLRSIFLVDTFTDLASNTRSYDGPGLQYNNDSTLGSVEATLLAREVATYTATYTVVAADVAEGGLVNQIVATSYIYPNGNATVYAQDTSDDGDDEDGNTEDDQTITFTGQLNSFEVTKTAAKVDDGNGVDNIGDQIVFTITVSNTGADQINDLTFTDTLTSARGVPLSLDSQPVFVSGTNGSTATTLALGGVITYTATFTVTQQVLDEGGVYNTITFSGSSARNPNPAEHDTEDVSDNGDDDDGNTEDDPTFFAVGVDNDQDGIPDLLDIDDDNDGVLDTFEKCIDFSIDGVSFENFDTGGGPVNANANYNSTFPVANVVAPFTSVDGRGRIWDTRFVNGKNWTPQDGTFFMELLQSATISGTVNPANTQAYWNESSYGIADFDRIMVQEYVYPNTTYNLTFYHMDGGISSATFADGGSTLVQVQGMDSDYQVSQLTEAPNDWTQQTFQFTTGPTTNKIAILFSAYSDGSDVAILLDNIGLTPQVSINCDVDGDGVGNGIDLDSDNDGIYDVVEAGNADLDTNGDGMIDENDAGFVDANANGAHDTIEGRTPTDTDSDTTVDMFDLDSDDDGCNDVIEAGYSDPNLDGLLGDNPVTVDANGKVTSGVDGYTDPSDLNSNATKDYQEATYDIACYNSDIGLEMTKTYQTIDVNSDGVLGLNDQIVYTVVVTNTGEIALPLELTDLLTNQDSQTIQTLDLEFVGLSSPTTYNIPKNYIKRSAGFNYATYSNSYWHTIGTDSNNNIDYASVEQRQPAEALVYFSTDSGATLLQSGFSSGGLHLLPQLVNNNVLSLKTQTTPGLSNLNSSNYSKPLC